MTVDELEREYSAPPRHRRSRCGGIFDAPTQKQKLATTEQQIAQPDFWSQPEKSQKVMQDRKRLEEAITNDEQRPRPDRRPRHHVRARPRRRERLRPISSAT